MSEQAANANTSPASTKKYATNISGTPRTRSKQDNTISNQEQAKNGSGSPEVDINQNVRSPEEISKVGGCKLLYCEASISFLPTIPPVLILTLSP